MIPWSWTLSFLEGFFRGFLEAFFVAGVIMLVYIVVKILALGLYKLHRKERGMK